MKQSVLLLGASGHLGQSIRQLAPQGVRLHCLSSAECDLRHAAGVRQLITQQIKHKNIQLLINAAAYTNVEQAEQQADEAYAINAEGVAQLAQACAATDTPLMHFSTDYVFDGQKGQPYSEGDLPRPINVYGQSKLAGEQALQAMHPMHWLIRVSWLHGPYGKNFAQQLIARARSGQPINMVTDQIGSPTNTMQLAHSIWQIVEAQLVQPSLRPLPWGLYHYTTSEPCSRYEYAQRILTAAKKQGLIDQIPKLLPTTMQNYPSIAQRPTYSALRANPVFKNYGLQL